MSLEDLLSYYIIKGYSSCLAFNIKSDGLQGLLIEVLKKHKIDNYFFFDMSIPDMLGYMHHKIPFAARISEYEQKNALVSSAKWIWLDAFNDE